MDQIIQKLKNKAVDISSKIEEASDLIDVLALERKLIRVNSQIMEYEAYKVSEATSFDDGAYEMWCQ